MHPGPDDRAHAAATAVDDVLRTLDVDASQGLDDAEVTARQRQHGPNRLRESKTRGPWDILIDQFRNVIVLLLLAAAVASASFGKLLEAIAIAAALVVNAVIGFVTELRAQRSMASLRSLDQSRTRVRREGSWSEIPSSQLVPGDIVGLDEGAMVPADLRLIEAADLAVDEAALTGESVPVAKSTAPVERGTQLADRSSMACKGTAVSTGTALGVVVATGMDTEIGHIAGLVEEAAGPGTPLERRLDMLGRRLLWLTLAMAALVGVAGLTAGRDPFTIIETAIVLGVAAVPEGLPIVAALALARGVRRMAARNALVKRLSSVETLGSASIIMTDKTGTLTEGQMRLTVLATLDDRRDLGDERDPLDEPFTQLLETAVLCTEADLDGDSGDPMDLAILRAGRGAGVDRDELEDRMPRRGLDPFDRSVRMMATFHATGDELLLAVKGAPGAVLEAATRCMDADGNAAALDDDARQAWRRRNRDLAGQGLRVLAIARASRGEVEDEPYRDLTLLGLIGLLDPARDSVVAAIEECHRAGIRVLMVTGDQPATAAAIAREVGIVRPEDDSPELVVRGADIDDPDEEAEPERQRLRAKPVFARVSPEHKLDLVRLHRQTGAVVGMTGDGVNDAPALEEADIGIAMGERGTDVAREAADIVLLDDAFGTIVEAVRYGRTVFRNIRKFIVYLLSGNLAEILAVTAATVAGLPLPLLPLQILYINFVADVFPALALGMAPTATDVMDEPPRDPDEPILTRRLWVEVGLWGVLIAVTVLAGLVLALWRLDVPADEVAGVTFLTFGFARVWHIFNMRGPRSGMLRNEVTTNPLTWVAVGIGVGLMLAAALFGPLAGLLDVTALDPGRWSVILGASLAPLLIGQLVRAVQSP